MTCPVATVSLRGKALPATHQWMIGERSSAKPRRRDLLMREKLVGGGKIALMNSIRLSRGAPFSSYAAPIIIPAGLIFHL